MRCTTDLGRRRIIEEVKRNNLPAVLAFIDFKKAFDCIHQGNMIKILKAYGVSPRLLKAVEATYTGTIAKVVSPRWSPSRRHTGTFPVHHQSRLLSETGTQGTQGSRSHQGSPEDLVQSPYLILTLLMTLKAAEQSGVET